MGQVAGLHSVPTEKEAREEISQEPQDPSQTEACLQLVETLC